MSKRYTEAEWNDRAMLRQHWSAFCDADPVPEDFLERMEVAGFIRLRLVTRRDVASASFAYERGIELGGSLWELTKIGADVYTPTRPTADAATTERDGLPVDAGERRGG